MFEVAVASLDLEFLWWLFRVVIANHKRSFEAINELLCEKVKYNDCFFFVARSWPLSEKNFFLDAKAAFSEYTTY